MAASRLTKPIYLKLFLKAFRNAPYGNFRFTTPRGRVFTFKGTHDGPQADASIADWDVARRILLRGDIGAGEAYIDGLWQSNDIGALMTYMVMNLDHLDGISHGNWIGKLAFRLVNFMRTNTKSKSVSNIRSHYDVGNAFYQLWLDKTMTYSAALFEGENDKPLCEAQRSKYCRIIDKIKEENASILEIGCGWGGFAEEAARAGHSVRGITLSKEQHAFALQRMKEHNFENNAQLVIEDYRDTQGSFDAIVSIEMFEAVGEKYWPVYFETVKKRLKETGRAIVQTITIADDAFDDYRQRSDFIRHYTFPGGMLPSVQKIKEHVANVGLECKEIFHFGNDYALTLEHWLDRLDSRIDEVKQLGYSDEFIRSWRFYLACCIGAFHSQRCDVVQIELTHA